MTIQLTSRQSNVLAFIRARLSADGEAPTLEEIGARTGHWPRQCGAQTRAFARSQGPADDRTQPRARHSSGARTADPMDNDTLELPLIGRIAAGEPMFSESRVERSAAGVAVAVPPATGLSGARGG
jgi:repressor LexA